jgi:NADH-quinone oxidoreductase subunit J
MEAFLFYFFSTAAVLSALAVVLPPDPKSRAPIHSAIAMVVCFFFIAALYAMLSAHLLAVLQVLVYAGAIMVLFVFVIMLLNLQHDPNERTAPPGFFKMLGGLMAVTTTWGLITKFRADDFLAPISAQLVEKLADPVNYGNLKDIGRLLFNKYLLPFELTSVLLLTAMVGAVIVAKRDPRTTWIPEAIKQVTTRERHGKHVEKGTP